MDNEFSNSEFGDDILHTPGESAGDPRRASMELDNILSDKDRDLLAFIDHISVPIFVWKYQGDDFVFIGFNKYSMETVGHDLSPYLCRGAKSMYRDFPWMIDELNRCLREKDRSTKELKYRFMIAGIRDLLATFTYVPPDLVLVHSEDITEKRRIQNDLAFRLKLVNMISSTSTGLINAGEADLKGIIENSLRQAGTIMSADSCALTIYPARPGIAAETFLWEDRRGVGIDLSSPEFSAGKFPEIFEKLGKLESLFISRPADNENTDRQGNEILKFLNVNSILILPAVLNSRLAGCLCFTSLNANLEIREDSIALLRMLAESFMNICALREAEKALKNSEASYRDLVENISEIIYSTDDNGIITYVSPSVRLVGGYDPSELTGKPFKEFVYDNDIQAVTGNFEQYRKGRKEPSDIEARFKTKTGGIIWGRISIKPVISGNRFQGVRGILADVSEKKKADNALKESEERYRAVWENSPVGISLTDRDGVYHYVNPAYCGIYGYSEDELIGRPFYEIIAPGYSGASVREKHNRIFDTGYTFPLGEMEFVRKNGEKVVVQYTSDFVRRDGTPIYMVTMNIDITENKKAERALKASQERYGLLIENAAELIMSFKADGKLVMINPAAARYLGRKADDFREKTIWDIFPRETADQRMIIIRQVIEKNSSLEIEETIRFADRERWFRTGIHPILDHETGIGAAQIIAHDITEEREKSLRSSARMKLLERLRGTSDINLCLQCACDAIFDASLFRRSVFTIYDDELEIEYAGQRNYDSGSVEYQHRSIPAANLEEIMLGEKSGKWHSRFIPAGQEPDVLNEINLSMQDDPDARDRQAWKDGDRLLVPAIGEAGFPIGWLSVDVPFDGQRPDKDGVIFLEETVDIVTQHIRELQARVKLERERRALEEKNQSLEIIMANIEEEKTDLRKKIIADVSDVILPILHKVIHKDGTLNIAQYGLLKSNLENLVSSHGGMDLKLSKLSSRELQICDLIKNGATNPEISSRLSISVATVKKHRESIREKLGVKHKSVNLTTFLQNL